MLRSGPGLALLAMFALTLPVRAENVRERDVETLARRSSLIIRGEIVGLGPDGVDVHVLAAYSKKGELPQVLHVRTDGERTRPVPGERALFFISPGDGEAGGLAFVQEDGERWPLEGDGAALDPFLTRLVASASQGIPAALWLEGLAVPSPAIAGHAAKRLATAARQGALAPKEWEALLGFLQGDASDEAKTGLVLALGDALPAERAAGMLRVAKDGSKLKVALMAAVAARSGSASQHAQLVKDELAQDADPEVARAAAEALAALGDESAIPALDRALRSGLPAARQGAVEALAKLAGQGSRAARARLKALFEDPDGLVRARARQAWTHAYLNDPHRVERTRPSLILVGLALLMILGVALHAWWDSRE